MMLIIFRWILAGLYGWLSGELFYRMESRRSGFENVALFILGLLFGMATTVQFLLDILPSLEVILR